MFSRCAGFFNGKLNALYREKKAIIKKGLPITDFISANVTAQGICYPRSILRKAFSQAVSQAKIYQPDPQGQRVTRLAIQKYYAGEGARLPADHILLTPGTSVSYWYLFKLLAHPGDEILCPTPTYPLFDSIAALCDVNIVSYRLVPENRWTLDVDHLKSQITPRTRAIVLISPHNPTGAVLSQGEIEQLCAIAVKHRLPIISDEVFSPFLFCTTRLPRPIHTDAPLVFTLNGISKMLALPGVKIGWIGVSGEPKWVKDALQILIGISDTFLPVNEPAQFALPTLLAEGVPFIKAYQSHVLRRFRITMSTMRGSTAFSFIPPEGGFYLAIRMNDNKCNEEKIALKLLRKEKILVHPGFFYDFPSGYLVCCYTAEPRQLREGLKRMCYFLGRL